MSSSYKKKNVGFAPPEKQREMLLQLRSLLEHAKEQELVRLQGIIDIAEKQASAKASEGRDD